MTAADGEGAGRPIPNPSYNRLVASSRGDRGGISCDDGVVGEPADLDDPEDEASSASTSEESIAITGSGCETATLNRRGWGRDFVTGEGVTDSKEPSPGGGVILTEGGGVVKEVALFGPLNTELLFPPLLQETAESDLEGLEEPVFMLLDKGLPSTVPPLITVVRLGVGGGMVSSWPSSSWTLRLPNLPLSAAVIGSS